MKTKQLVSSLEIILALWGSACTKDEKKPTME